MSNSSGSPLLKVMIWLYEKIHRATVIRKVKSQLSQGILQVGRHTYGIYELMIDVYKGSESKVIIGKYCSISKNVRIITGGIHPSNWGSTYPFRAKWDLLGKFEDGMPYSKGDVVIGNDVWIGTGVTILSGVEIGHGAILAACSVIAKDVPPYAVFGGNPAKLIRYRFDEQTISNLLEKAWWNWSDEKVMENIEFLNSPINFKLLQ